ncbi:MAG TPA: peptide chain release factor-like protein [Smithella sp.]|nr:peptide chain release factor-like protein [Smithella sp.]HRS97490.1 peptide chain release factor-like protein [Smithella sp.]
MPVSKEKENALLTRMNDLGVKEKDFQESFIRSSGPGGQKVNKSSSCVYLVHLPTGLSVKCQKERSQSLNRFLAKRMLLDKIEKMKTGFVSRQRDLAEKIRRQKRKRSKRAKEKTLKDKHIRSEIKSTRKAVRIGEEP